MLLDAIFGLLTVVCWPGVVSAALLGGLFYLFGGLKLAAVGVVIGAIAGCWPAVSRDPTANSVGAETVTKATGSIILVGVAAVAVLYWPIALAIVALTLIANAFI
jgi:hypothetical protein